MRVNSVFFNKAYKFGFKSIRTDKHTVEQLSIGEKPITVNNKQNIYAALGNLSQIPTADNISFLLSVAGNLAYGQGKNTVFKDTIDNDNITPETRENTDWTQILQDTIKTAMSLSEDDLTEQRETFNRIFSEKKELTPEQSKLLNLRTELTSYLVKKENMADEEALIQVVNARKNLDYFVASSEVSIQQKSEVLNKLIYFMSDDYKIDSQLKGRKLQVLDEMLSDLVVKAPDSEVLKTKDIDQRSSGMCASISICRKAMAYEDKVKFVDLILDELKDSPTMSVYDITELGSGKKVNIPKTKINYNIAMAKGYRIIDASAHNWMHNAHASGNGTIQTEHYIAFDEDNYGIFDDSSWYTLDDETYPKEKALLRALIKENEYINSFYKRKKEMNIVHDSVNAAKKDYRKTMEQTVGRLNTVFKDIFPEKSEIERTKLISALFGFYTGVNEQNEANISDQMSADLKENIIESYIKENAGEITAEQADKIKENISLIHSMVQGYIEADKKIASLKRFNTPKSRYIQYKKLFNIAAAHRLSIERDVDLPDGILRFERHSGLPPRDIQVVCYLKSLRAGFSSNSLNNKFFDRQGNALTLKDLEADIEKIENIFPKELDNIMQTLLGLNLQSMLKRIFENTASAIKDGDTSIFERTKRTLDIDGDKHKVVEVLNKWIKKLSDNPSEEDILEALRIMGYDDRKHVYTIFKYYFFKGLQQGISEEQYNHLVKVFGGKDKVKEGIESNSNKFTEINDEYSEILERWKVPTAREKIIKHLEKSHDILTRHQLEELKNHFSMIEAGMAANESIENTKARNKANQKLWKFSKPEEEVFAAIEKNLYAMKKYCKMQYQNLNDILFDELENKYADIGMLNGQFWVREEGVSGLAANEQIRIIEQMTGKPYHMETDIKAAASEIKSGNGSGILSMSIDDKDYAFHAQYVPSVTSEEFINPFTNEKTIKDIIWTDNSWGNSEKEYFWNGHNGFHYTDYGRGYGLKDGFILSDDRKIGLPVDTIHGAIGIAEKDDGDEFGLFTDVILPESPIKAYQKIYKMFKYIFQLDDVQNLITKLENSIEKGEHFSIKYLEALDDIANAKVERISKRAKEEIKSEADFDNLPEDDELKMVFKKLAVYMCSDNPVLTDAVPFIETDKELQEIQDDIFAEQLDFISSILGKSTSIFGIVQYYALDSFNNLFDEIMTKFNIEYTEEQRSEILSDIFLNKEGMERYNGSINNLENILVNLVVDSALKHIDDEETARYFIEESIQIIKNTINEHIKIKSLDSAILNNSPLGKNLINAIDKYLEPKSDEEMIQLLQELQAADMDTANKFFEAFKPEDLGIINKKPYDYLLLYNADNSDIKNSLREMIEECEIYKDLNQSEDKEDAENEELSAEDLYRTLYVKLSDMDVQKFIKSFKAEAFQKYKVRQAFPDPVVLEDSEIAQTVNETLNLLESKVCDINGINEIIQMLLKYEELKNDYIYNSDFVRLINQEEIDISNDDYIILTNFKQKVAEIYKYVCSDNSIKYIAQAFADVIETCTADDNGKINGEKLRNKISELKNILDKLNSQNVNLSVYSKDKRNSIKELKETIRMFVVADVDPKYRNETIHLIKQYLNMYRKGVSDEELMYQKAYIIDFIIEHHIIKNPTALLKEVTKMLFAGQKDSDEYEIMREYLSEALKVAQQTKIQYRLVQNQHEGISSKIKDMISMFNVKMPDGSQRNMEGEVGMLYLIQKLKNAGDNYKTMNLFLEQSGLSERALNAVIKNFEIEKTKDLIQEKYNEVMEDIHNLDKLAGFVSNYMSSNDKKYPSREESIADLILNAKKEFKDWEDVNAYKKFINYLESLKNTGTSDSLNKELIVSLTESIAKDSLRKIVEEIDKKLKFMSGIYRFAEERVELIMSVKVPIESEAYKNRVEFLKKYEGIKSFFETKMTEMFSEAQNCEYLAAEKKEAI